MSDTSRRAYDIPEDNEHLVWVKSGKGQAIDDIWQVVSDLVSERYPKGNLMGLQPVLIGGFETVFVYLKKKLDEALDPVLARVYGQVYDVLTAVNTDWRKDFGGDRHFLYHISAFYSDHLLTFRLTRDTNFDFELFYEGIEQVKEALRNKGILDGMLPVVVEFSKPYGDPVKIDIHVTRSGRAAR